MGEKPPGQIDAGRAIIRAALTTPSPLERYQPGETRRAADGGVLLVDGPHGRHVIVVGPEDPERVFRLAEAFFGDPGDFACELDLEEAAALDEALRARGWRTHEEEPALVLAPLPPERPPAPPGLAIYRVVDKAGLAHFQALSPSAARWVPTLAAATGPAVALFVGYVDGLPAATSRLVRLGATADLTSVNTAPAFRRRGYGTAMTWAAIAEGARRGCTAATLTATPMGYPVYLAWASCPSAPFARTPHRAHQ